MLFLIRIIFDSIHIHYCSNYYTHTTRLHTILTHTKTQTEPNWYSIHLSNPHQKSVYLFIYHFIESWTSSPPRPPSPAQSQTSLTLSCKHLPNLKNPLSCFYSKFASTMTSAILQSPFETSLLAICLLKCSAIILICLDYITFSISLPN